MKPAVILMFGAFFPLMQDAPEVRIYSAAWFPPNLTITADSNLVELAATVRDRQDHAVGSLKAADFEVLDDKHPRRITLFEELRKGRAVDAASDKAPSTEFEPRTSALYFDDDHASARGVHDTAAAAANLVEHELHPGDRVGIFTSSGATSLDFTAEKDRLLAALQRLRKHFPKGPKDPLMAPEQAYIVMRHMDANADKAAMMEIAKRSCPEPITPQCVMSQLNAATNTAMTAWETARPQFVDALVTEAIVVRHLAAASGRRIMILLGPGFPTGTLERNTSALVDAALRSDIRISAVNSEGLPPAPSPLHRKIVGEFLSAAAKSTGGQYIDYNNDIAGSLVKVSTGPEISYLLGFSPPGPPDDRFHALEVRIPGNRGYTVESRNGYFGARTRTETVQQRIDRIVMSSENIAGFPVTLDLRAGQGALEVTIRVDAKALRFPKKEHRRVQELTLLTVLEDAQGNFVEGKESVMDLAYTVETLAEKLQKGLQAATSLPIPRPGAYRVREVVRELAQDRVWAGTASIEVR